MKPVVANKLMVLLLSNKRTMLHVSHLGNLDGEGHQIKDCERIFRSINVCLRDWKSATFSTITPKRNNKKS